jgi:transposase-like protein
VGFSPTENRRLFTAHSKERKEAVLKKMMPPHNRSIIELAREEGISAATLYLWRQQAREQGLLLPDSDRVPRGMERAGQVQCGG